jgi:hypothetical protein
VLEVDDSGNTKSQSILNQSSAINQVIDFFSCFSFRAKDGTTVLFSFFSSFFFPVAHNNNNNQLNNNK